MSGKQVRDESTLLTLFYVHQYNPVIPACIHDRHSNNASSRMDWREPDYREVSSQVIETNELPSLALDTRFPAGMTAIDGSMDFKLF